MAVAVKPLGVVTLVGLGRTCMFNVVDVGTTPAGKVSEARDPKDVSVMVPPEEVTVPVVEVEAVSTTRV